MRSQALQRISLRWLPDAAFEDTKTIALNVGRYFIDLRVTTQGSTIQWSRAGERIILKEEPCMIFDLLPTSIHNSWTLFLPLSQ